MDKIKTHKNVIIIICLIILTGVLVIGSTFSYFLKMDKEKTDATRVYTGTMGIVYIDGAEVHSPKLMPMEEPNTSDEEGAYRKRFRISTIGTLDQLISIKLDVSTNEFSDDMIRYAIFNDNGKKLVSDYINGTGNVELLSNLFLENETDNDFTLLIWLNENNQVQNNEQNRSLKGTIIIDSIQANYR